MADHKFVEWLQSDRIAYWICGKPGSGKSTLMKFIVKHSLTRKYLAMQANDPVNALFCYFFSEMSELSTQQEKSIEGLLHALLNFLLEYDHRLLSSVVGTYTQKVLPREDNLGLITPTWSIDNLKEALMEIPQQKTVQGRVCLFVDGFDECQGQRSQHLRFLLSWVESMRESGFHVKICLATRDLEELKEKLDTYPCLELNLWTENDIHDYVHAKLNGAVRTSISLDTSKQSEISSNLVNKVVKKAQGVFTWVKLVVAELVSDLKEDKDEVELQLHLDTLPPQLDLLYWHIISEIPIRDLPSAFMYFRILLRAPGQACTLTLLQFLLAAQDPEFALTCDVGYQDGEEREKRILEKLELMKQRLTTRCRNLVQVRMRKDALIRWEAVRRENVTFIHVTFKEFLLKPENDKHIRERIKLTHIQIIASVDPLLMASYILLLKTQRFCLPHWAKGRDLQRQNIQQANRDIENPARPMPSIQPRRSFSGNDDHVDETEYAEEISQRAPDNYITIFFNYAQNLELGTGEPQVEYIDELDKVLLQADENWASKFYLHRTLHPIPEVDILCLAICCKLKLYVKQKLTPQHARKQRNPPLLFYAMNPPGWIYTPVDVEMLRLLIEAGVRINEKYIENDNQQTIWGHTLHHYLCIGTHHPADNWEEVLKLMLDNGANPNQEVFLRGGSYTSALHLLVDQYQKVIVTKRKEVERALRLLFQHKATLERKDSKDVTALEHARNTNTQLFHIIKRASKFGDKIAENAGTTRTTRAAAAAASSRNILDSEQTGQPKITQHQLTNTPAGVQHMDQPSRKRPQKSADVYEQGTSYSAPNANANDNQSTQTLAIGQRGQQSPMTRSQKRPRLDLGSVDIT
jgi:hypothetical protein